MPAVFHWGVWPDVLLQLQQRGGPAVVQHGLHDVCEDGAELLWYPVHRLCGLRQHPATGFLHHRGLPHPGQCGRHLLLHGLDHHPLRHQHQRPHHSVRHPRGLCGQDMWAGLQLSHHSKHLSQRPRIQLFQTFQHLRTHRQLRGELQSGRVQQQVRIMIYFVEKLKLSVIRGFCLNFVQQPCTSSTG